MVSARDTAGREKRVVCTHGVADDADDADEGDADESEAEGGKGSARGNGSVSRSSRADPGASGDDFNGGETSDGEYEVNDKDSGDDDAEPRCSDWEMASGSAMITFIVCCASPARRPTT